MSKRCSNCSSACEVIPAERLWVNADCGLKTRNWAEIEAALTNMVFGVRALRQRLAEQRPEASTACPISKIDPGLPDFDLADRHTSSEYRRRVWRMNPEFDQMPSEGRIVASKHI